MIAVIMMNPPVFSGFQRSFRGFNGLFGVSIVVSLRRNNIRPSLDVSNDGGALKFSRPLYLTSLMLVLTVARISLLLLYQ